MELHAMDGSGAVREAHDLAIVGQGGDLERVGNGIRIDRQAVIAGGGEAVRQASEDAPAAMADGAHLAVHRDAGMDNACAERLADRLMPQADP